jgi:RNA polymerase subunit RPABC4/transcription elongation factor Spt4
MAVNCTGCGTRLPDDAEKCPSCGAPRSASTPTQHVAGETARGVVDVELATKKAIKVTGPK